MAHIEIILKDYQTLIAGILAIMAAIISGKTILKAARLPEEHAKMLRIEDQQKMRIYASAIIDAHLFEMSSRATQAIGTIKVHVAANTFVTDETKKRMLLQAPLIIGDWKFTSLLKLEHFEELMGLHRAAINHNFDIDRTSGAFGADNFRNQLIERLEFISKRAFSLANDIRKYRF